MYSLWATITSNVCPNHKPPNQTSLFLQANTLLKAHRKWKHNHYFSETCWAWAMKLHTYFKSIIACCCCGYFFFFLTPIVLWSLLHPSSVWVQLLCDWHKQIPALMNRLTDLSSSCWVLRAQNSLLVLELNFFEGFAPAAQQENFWNFNL